MSLSVPVVLIIFNRPDLTQIVFNAIAQVKPKQLFVIADAPRNPEEAEKCEKTRAIIKQVNWDCEVKNKFSEQNLTGPYCISGGLNWVFSQVEEAIILEDDCLPSISFFNYCQELLDYYRYDDRIMHITGNNFQVGQSRTEFSYYFSKYTTNWGWATWRKAWEKFDLNLSNWPKAQAINLLDKICDSAEEKEYWSYFFERVFTKESVHWDYAWQFICWYHNGLTITPNVNLVSNLGFRQDATHTQQENAAHANLPIQEITTEINHPSTIEINQEADKFTFDFRFKADQPQLKKQISIKDMYSHYVQYLPKEFRLKHREKWRSFKIHLKTHIAKITRPLKRPPFPNLPDNQVNLHVGCGQINHPSFINVDIVAYPHIHYVRLINDLKPFDNETVDLIYASHCLKHFPFAKVPEVLKEWLRVLKPNGILRLAVPDFDLLLEVYNQNNHDLDQIVKPLMGWQNSKYNYHLAVFNKSLLTNLLKDVGFTKVQRWQPSSSYLTAFNDCSNKPLIINGKIYPTSLNLEAIK